MKSYVSTTNRVVKDIEHLYELYQALDKAREQRGAIGFESKKRNLFSMAERRIDRIEPVVRNDAHKLIEECMILANIAAARFVEKNEEPALYRVHDKPKEESVMNLRSVFNELGLTLPGGLTPSQAIMRES